MRNFGMIMLLLGIAGAIYCTMELGGYEPVPPDLGIMESLEYPAGKLQTGQYAFGVMAAFGFVLAMVPRR